MDNTITRELVTDDFLDFVKTSYEHKLVEFDPKNPLFWNRYKMKKEIDKWKDDISNAFWINMRRIGVVTCIIICYH